GLRKALIRTARFLATVCTSNSSGDLRAPRIVDQGLPSDWFPPSKGPVVVIGNPGSVFPRHLVALWRSMGIDARIVTRRWEGGRQLADGTPVIVAEDHESRIRRETYRSVERAVWQVESRLVARQRERYARAMGSETSYRPFVSPWIADALGISRAVARIRPQFVCGQEVFAYGLATVFS